MLKKALLILLYVAHNAFAQAHIAAAKITIHMGPSQGQSRPPLPLTIYKSLQADGSLRFADHPPIAGEYELVKLHDCFACQPKSSINWQQTDLFLTPYRQAINAAAHAFEVEPALIRALIHAESAFNPNARSAKGAMGLTQLMPATAKELGVSNPFIATENIFGGVRYLSALLKQYHGNIALASAAYNAGSGAVKKYAGVPPYAETQAYVQRVQWLYQRYKKHLHAASSTYSYSP